MEIKLEPSWKHALKQEFEQPYFTELTKTIRERYLTRIVFPPPQHLFRALDLCPLDVVQVVLLGQDPYHGRGQAHGLSFSVPNGVQIPPSLLNIYKEIQDDVGALIPDSGNLERWAAAGVLLLNATLTVENAQPGSHQGLGWERFTDAIISAISRQKQHVVFLLWGKYAQAKVPLIDANKHLILQAPHPSPFSAHSGFFGCKHFSKTNHYLTTHGFPPIPW